MARQRGSNPSVQQLSLALRLWLGTADPASLLNSLDADSSATLVSARRHRIIYPLAIVADSYPTARLPLGALSDARRQQTFACMAQAQTAGIIMDVLTTVGAKPILIKGLALAAVAYSDFTARGAGDIDVLVDGQGLQRGVSALNAIGGVTIGASRHTVNVSFRGALVELHHRLDPNPSVMRVPHDELWMRRKAVGLGGARVDTLDEVDSLLLAASNGSRDAWPTLRSVLDVARLAGLSQGQRATAQGRATDLGVGRQLTIALSLAGRLQGHSCNKGGAAERVASRVWRALAADRDLRTSRGLRDRVERNVLVFASLDNNPARWHAVLRVLQPRPDDRRIR